MNYFLLVLAVALGQPCHSCPPQNVGTLTGPGPWEPFDPINKPDFPDGWRVRTDEDDDYRYSFSRVTNPVGFYSNHLVLSAGGHLN